MYFNTGMSDLRPDTTSTDSFTDLTDYPVDELEARRGADRVKSLMEIFIKIDQRERKRNESNGNQHHSNQAS